MKISESRLQSFVDGANSGLSRRSGAMTGASGSVASLANTNSITGAAADSMKAYLGEVYSSGLLTQINDLLDEFVRLNTEYASNYSGGVIDGGGFKLSSEDYSDLNSKIGTLHSEVESTISRVNSKISHLSGLIGGASKIHDFSSDVQQLKTDISRQRTAWSQYESRASAQYEAIQDGINFINQAIARYASRSAVQMTGYTSGSFRQELASFQSQHGYSALSYFENLHRFMDEKVTCTDKNHHVHTATNRELIYRQRDGLHKLVQARVRAAVEESKREGWTKLAFDSAFFIGGVALTVASGGTAVPVLLTLGSTAMSLLNIEEDINQGRTGKENDNWLKNGLRSKFGLSVNTANNVFNVLDYGTSIISGKGAWKALEGKQIVKSAKVSSILDRQMSSFVNHGYFTPVLSDTKDFVVDVAKHANPISLALVHGKELLKPVATEYTKEIARVTAKKQVTSHTANWVNQNFVESNVSSNSIHGYARPVLEQAVKKRDQQGVRKNGYEHD
ncbi:T7SS effector LXG polymorphic toxin [Limosilactobacillus equigenerosi]|uniref:T7SS effector LXG polymorphic toxin n=1 Tax=Limosilactobacillus equigenerosi TaxID=417373 RepID=UPI0006CF532A|nr:T7SS effector LXG polymorphic toxin [Limosilactobacillus equigenerosi]